MVMGDGMKALAALASAQFGLVASHQLAECMVTRNMVHGRIRHGAMQPSRYRGVYRFSGAPQTWESRAMELLLYCGPNAALSHDTAAYLHGLDGFSTRPDVFHVLMPQSYLMHAPPHHIHRTRASKIHSTMIDGLPVTSVVRSLTDLGETLTRDDFEKAFDSARRLHKNLEPWLNQFAEKKENARRPGIALIKQLFAERSSALDSIFEVEMRQIFLADQIPLPHFGYTVFDEGKPLIKLDGAWLNFNGRNTALHCDGFGPHSRRKQFERDARQRTRLSVLGWTQIMVTWNQIHDPEWRRDLRLALGI